MDVVLPIVATNIAAIMIIGAMAFGRSEARGYSPSGISTAYYSSSAPKDSYKETTSAEASQQYNNDSMGSSSGMSLANLVQQQQQQGRQQGSSSLNAELQQMEQNLGRPTDTANRYGYGSLGSMGSLGNYGDPYGPSSSPDYNYTNRDSYFSSPSGPYGSSSTGSLSLYPSIRSG
jgi:hypothetical protein